MKSSPESMSPKDVARELYSRRFRVQDHGTAATMRGYASFNADRDTEHRALERARARADAAFYDFPGTAEDLADEEIANVLGRFSKADLGRTADALLAMDDVVVPTQPNSGDERVEVRLPKSLITAARQITEDSEYKLAEIETANAMRIARQTRGQHNSPVSPGKQYEGDYRDDEDIRDAANPFGSGYVIR